MSATPIKPKLRGKTLLLLCLPAFFLLTPCMPACAQQWVALQNPDSLKKVLLTARDTQRVNTLNLLARRNLYMDFDHTVSSSQSYTEEALALATKLGYARGMGNSYLNLGITAEKGGRCTEALAALQKATYLSRQAGDRHALAASYDFTGLAFMRKGDNRKALTYFDSTQALYTQLGDTITSAWAMINISKIHLTLGDYTNAYKYGQAAYERTPVADTTLRAVTLYLLANIFLGNGLPELTLEQVRKVAVYFPSRHTRDDAIRCYPGFNALILGGEAFLQLGQVDSALKIAAIIGPPRNKGDMAHLLFWGRLYTAQQQYGKALPYFQQALAWAKQGASVLLVSEAAREVASTYLGLHDFRQAVHYAQQALQVARQIDALPEMSQAASTLSEIYGSLKDYDRAYYYSKLQRSLNDSLMPQEYKRKLALIRAQDELAFQERTAAWLAREGQLKEQQLKRESLLKNLLLGGLLLIGLMGLIAFRNMTLKRKNERLRLSQQLQLQQFESERAKARLQQQAATLEMQALRAQMNPHFIFNSLNSINRFILQNDKGPASEYLTKFSRLVRLILQNSQADLVPLESELEALQLYLELEALRFEQHFEYTLRVDENTDVEVLKVPPLVIQPFAENAIWHGLMHKEEKGHLEIDITQREATLYCRITDDGIGRKKAAELRDRAGNTHRSMGMRITADRIALLKEQKLAHTSIQVNDLVLPDGSAGGTEVVLKLPTVYDQNPTN